MLETPKGPRSDAFETRNGTEATFDHIAAQHAAEVAPETPQPEAKTSMQEALQARGDAINNLTQAKENLGVTPGDATTAWDKKMDDKFGIKDNRPTSAGGRVA